MRSIVLALAACTLAACAGDVAMQNPKTGQSVVCKQSLAGFDPWSQTYACATARAEQGWRIVGQPY